MGRQNVPGLPVTRSLSFTSLEHWLGSQGDHQTFSQDAPVTGSLPVQGLPWAQGPTDWNQLSQPVPIHVALLPAGQARRGRDLADQLPALLHVQGSLQGRWPGSWLKTQELICEAR